MQNAPGLLAGGVCGSVEAAELLAREHVEMDVVDGLPGELADIRHHAVTIRKALLLRDLRDDRVDVADDGGVFLRRLGS